MSPRCENEFCTRPARSDSPLCEVHKALERRHETEFELFKRSHPTDWYKRLQGIVPQPPPGFDC